MYHTCLHCTRDLGRNDILEPLPVGRRIAFDAGQGRLWVVCRSCAKWNLVPFDNRLEAIDACERIFRDTRTRFSTDTIGLARVADGTDFIRIGTPQRPEFASWRYGAQYRRRRNRSLALGGLGIAMLGVAPIAVSTLMPSTDSLGLGLMAGIAGAAVPSFAWTAFESRMMRVLAVMPGESKPRKLEMTALGSTHLAMDDGQLSVSWTPDVVAGFRKRHLTVSGGDARLLARRMLASLNGGLGSRRQLAHAVTRMQGGKIGEWVSGLNARAVDFLKLKQLDRLRASVASASRLLAPPKGPVRFPGFGENSFHVGSLPRGDRLALEMWLSEEDEARALAGELALLERQWREAEELAAIADRLA